MRLAPWKIIVLSFVVFDTLLAFLWWHIEGTADPEAAAACVKLGISKGVTGDLDQAIAEFNEAIKLNPQSAPAYENRGYALFLQKKTDEAISDYDQALHLDPTFQDAYYNRGNAKAQKGDFDGAISDFDYVIGLNPKYAAAYCNRAHAKYFKGDLDGALSDLDQALTLNPGPRGAAVIYFIRGLVRRAQYDGEGATADFQKSAGLGFPYSVFWLWIVKMEEGDPGVAHLDLLDFSGNKETFKPDDWPAQVADFLLEKISQDQLMAWAQNSGGPVKERLCEAWFYAGMVKHFSGDTTGALDCFHQSLATGATLSEEFLEARREVSKLQQP